MNRQTREIPFNMEEVINAIYGKMPNPGYSSFFNKEDTQKATFNEEEKEHEKEYYTTFDGLLKINF